MKAKTIALACAAAVCGAAFADEETESTGWAYNPGEGVSFNEQPIVSAEFSLAFDSKYLSYGLVDNKDPILTLAGGLTFFDWVSLEVESLFDITKYGRRAGYTSRAWEYTELHPGVSIGHSFSPDDYEWLPTTVDIAIGYQYEYHPNAKYKGGDGPDGQADDTQFWTVEFGLPDLWFEPVFLYERDVMRDNGTYLNLEIGHTFALVDGDEEGEDPILTFRPSVSQGFGNTMRVRSYLTRATSDGEGAPLDKSGLMDLCVKGELAWQICDFCSLSGYVAYTDYVFDSRMREAARLYEATGDWDHSWNFIAGLALTVNF